MRPKHTIGTELEHRVGVVVREVIASLPDDLRSLAESIPVFCEWEMADQTAALRRERFS